MLWNLLPLFQKCWNTCWSYNLQSPHYVACFITAARPTCAHRQILAITSHFGKHMYFPPSNIKVSINYTISTVQATVLKHLLHIYCSRTERQQKLQKITVKLHQRKQVLNTEYLRGVSASPGQTAVAGSFKIITHKIWLLWWFLQRVSKRWTLFEIYSVFPCFWNTKYTGYSCADILQLWRWLALGSNLSRSANPTDSAALTHWHFTTNMCSCHQNNYNRITEC